jgi:hypothetical protein
MVTVAGVKLVPTVLIVVALGVDGAGDVEGGLAGGVVVDGVGSTAAPPPPHAITPVPRHITADIENSFISCALLRIDRAELLSRDRRGEPAMRQNAVVTG